ncbi:MAG: hypothetical protein LBE34_16205 [Flavobacteriaceae bacterium]|jgi:hypothetical protein|nr:hypothetical protein [Flavobacteriaceae bacterium]
MNFDDLKKTWQEQETPNVLVEPTNINKKDSRLPLEKIRKNVLKDLWAQGLSIVFIGFLPFYYKLPTESIPLFYIFYFLFTAITVYFLVKMYLFYRTSNSFTMNSRDSLYEVYFSVRMYIQLYENFCYSLLPFVGIIIPYIVGSRMGNYNELLNNKTFIIVFIIFFSFTLWFVRYWIKKLYGQYLIQIEETLKQFKEQE